MVLNRTEEEVDKMIKEMSGRTKGSYVTQGVAFNKTCPRQMKLLKSSLMSSVSFSGLMKELIATTFDNSINNEVASGVEGNKNKDGIRDYGNFL